MGEGTASQGNLVRAFVLWAIALGAGIVVGFVIGRLLGLGTAAGLIFGAVTFFVLPWLVPARGSASGPELHAHTAVPSHTHDHASPTPATPAEPQRLADLPVAEHTEGPMHADTSPTPPPGGVISERVRDAARAAGEAARALAGDGADAIGTRPATLSAPREGGPDDLKRLKGVGRKFEVVLHEVGIFHFDQIAAWGPAEIAWIDANLDGFSGRAVREDWMGQAQILAAGGETEHSQRVDRGESF